MISFPLCALLTYSDSVPKADSPSAATSRFTVPLAARCWQSRHQQIRARRGSVARLKVTAPHRQRPVRSVIVPASVGGHAASGFGAGDAIRRKVLVSWWLNAGVLPRTARSVRVV